MASEQEIFQTGLGNLQGLLGFLKKFLSPPRKGLTDVQVLGLAALSRAVSVGNSACSLLAAGEVGEIGTQTRVLLELAHKFQWLVGDDSQRDLRLDLFRHQRLRDQRRALESVSQSSPLKQGGLAYLDAMAKTRLQIAKEAEDASRKELLAKHGKVTFLHDIGIKKIFEDLGQLETYDIQYRHFSTQDHSEGIHLEFFVDGDENQGLTFWPPRPDGLLLGNLLAIYSYLQLLANLVYLEIGQPAELGEQLAKHEQHHVSLAEGVANARDVQLL